MQDGGELVVAIVSTVHIPAGTELTYDYRWGLAQRNTAGSVYLCTWLYLSQLTALQSSLQEGSLNGTCYC
jgi:hypothetical protein